MSNNEYTFNEDGFLVKKTEHVFYPLVRNSSGTVIMYFDGKTYKLSIDGIITDIVEYQAAWGQFATAAFNHFKENML